MKRENKIESTVNDLDIIVLRMDLRVVHNDSWMNMMSKSWLTSRTVLIRKLLF